MISDINSLDNQENDYKMNHKMADGTQLDTSNLQDSINHIEGIEDIEEIEEIDDEDEVVEIDQNFISDRLDDDSDSQLEDASPKLSDSKANGSSLLANQFDEMSATLMKPVPDYPVTHSGHHVWSIKNWSSQPNKCRGPKFKIGNFEWNILLFPRGNGNGNTISIYLEPNPIDQNEPDAPSNDNDPENTESKPKNWYVCAQFAFDIWNPNNPKSHISNASYHRFGTSEPDWGFSSFIDTNSLYKTRIHGEAPLVANDQVNITAYVKIIDDSKTGVLWYNFLDYDSKKSTGYVGLNNQGATCYLNSLLQSYFTTKIFRKLVYQIPTTSNTVVKSNKKIKKQSSVALSLQKIFYLLSTSKAPVGTLELTKSFGWDSNDAFTQHDIQELNRILMDKLETSMKNTPIENKLNDLFVGKMKSFIKCINVPYESSRVEDFWDIQLNVKGFNNLTDAFKNYIELEMLTDDNKYQAGDEYGYQDAKKGVVFESFPPVLHLQLKRFEYDFMIDDLQKINDLYEFPDEIDLSPYLDEDLPESVKKENWNYKLHGVLVHQGSISNGHYYAMIKPKAKGEDWLRFEDDRVWKVTKTEVFDHNFGADELSQSEFYKLNKLEQNENLIRRSTSAYMLVYYRENRLSDILPDDDNEIDKQIPAFIPAEIEQQLEEMKTIEELKMKQLYNINVKVVGLKNFQKYLEFDYYYDPTNTKFYDEELSNKDESLKPLIVNLKKTDSIFELFNIISESKGIQARITDASQLEDLPYRLLVVSHRNNQTNRVEDCTDFQTLLKESKEEELTISSVFLKLFNKKYDEMVFYLEEFENELNTVVSQTNHKPAPLEKFKWDTVFQKFGGNIKPVFKSLDSNAGSAVLFFKFFNPLTKELKGLTHAIVSRDEKVGSYIPAVKCLLDLEDKEELDIIEEITPNKLDVIDPELTFEKNELSFGDILIFVVKQPNSNMHLSKYFNFLSTRLHIKVSPVQLDSETAEVVDDTMEDEEILEVKDAKDDDGDTLDLWVSTTYTYDQLSESIASQIKQDPTYLRLFIINQQGYRFPMKTQSNLSQYFPKNLPISTVIRYEYEVLDIPLKEYENMKNIKVTWLHKILQFEEFEILISLDSTVVDLVEKLFESLASKNVDVNSIDKSSLFMYSGNNNKYVEYVKFDKSIESLNDSFEYYIGEFPVETDIMVKYDYIKPFEQSNKPPILKDEIQKYEYDLTKKYINDLNILTVFHFHKNSTFHHSIPFIFFVFPHETMKDTKRRLQNKLGMNDMNFSKLKIALADQNDKGKYVDDKDDAVLYKQLSTSLCHLALDHIDRNPKKNTLDKGIQIK